MKILFVEHLHKRNVNVAIHFKCNSVLVGKTTLLNAKNRIKLEKSVISF